MDQSNILKPGTWYSSGNGPLYQQLYRQLREAIATGVLASGTLLPPEREISSRADVSRVTVRKAIAALADDGLIEQKQGSGTYVRGDARPRLQQSLSSLVSFTEIMTMRGFEASSRVLDSGLFAPTPTETVALGLSGSNRVARIRRLRMAEPGALALEVSSIPEDILPNPNQVDQSLYAVLRETGKAPVRAIQRMSAVNLKTDEAEILGVETGRAFLKIDKTGYLQSGRPVEFSAGLYRSDIYDFVAEVRLEDGL